MEAKAFLGMILPPHTQKPAQIRILSSDNYKIYLSDASNVAFIQT